MNELTLDRVSVSRGAGPVARDVTLTISEGSITALVGPNGAGKTSLLESISAVISHSSGTIRLNDEVIDSLSRVKRSRAGIVHIEQGRAVFPSLTVRENIQLTAHTPTAFDDALAMFPELEKRIDAPTTLLSGGEQQMVVLARAFAAKPQFLLIDEMSLGLAPVVFTRLLPVITRAASAGAGVLLVEQFTNLALGIADDALVLASGRVTWQGPAAELKASPDVLHQAYLGTATPSAGV